MSILVIVATFLAAGVEWVEAFTIVLAVGLIRGWRSAALGAAVAMIALVVLVAVFGVVARLHRCGQNSSRYFPAPIWAQVVVQSHPAFKRPQVTAR